MINLLSRAVIGKSGHGKRAVLMGYVLSLLSSGVEVHVFDPLGVLKGLSILDGWAQSGTPAALHYYGEKDAIVAAVSRLSAEVDERQRQPFMREGNHPVVIVADEVRVLTDVDSQVKAEYKEREQDPPSLLSLIRRVVFEARKFRMFFLCSGQPLDELLDTE